MWSYCFRVLDRQVGNLPTQLSSFAMYVLGAACFAVAMGSMKRDVETMEETWALRAGALRPTTVAMAGPRAE